jgi:hypothetical protein
VPALVLTGLLDTTVLPATEIQLYNDLASDKKVLIKVDGGSHYMVWEGSTAPTLRGPHATLQDAVVQWITSETYRGSTRGTFRVHADGSIEEGGGPGSAASSRSGQGFAPAADFNAGGFSDLGVLVGVTEQRQSTSLGTAAFSTPGFAEGSPLAPFTSTAAMQSPAWDRAVRSVAAPLPASSSRVRGGAHDHILADFQRDWLSDTLVSDLVLAG